MEENGGMADVEFSILDLHPRGDASGERPAYFQDLNLDTVLDRLAVYGGRQVRRCFGYLPGTREVEAYRRAVYGDVNKQAVYDARTVVEKKAAGVEELRREKGKAPGSRQRAVWQLREIEAYCRACEELENALARAELASEGLRRFHGILREMLCSETFRKMRDQVFGVMERIRALRLVITYEKDRIRVELGEAPAEYEALAQGKGKPFQNPFAASSMLTELENACLDILKKKKPEFFLELQDAAQRYETYEHPAIARFEKEIRFYLSFCALQREMEQKGFAFAVPSVQEDRPMSGKGLYDLALACVSLNQGKQVVANDFVFRDGERFFVLSGPNQGGKTTFARSLGQLVYWARIGLDVPAAEANVPFFPDIQTHFSVEESAETGRGKLKEELTRLAPMMEAQRRGTFVIINELFTTAASYDALIMGRRVLEHFIGLGCMGIYVTHLRKLAQAHEQAVSLQAMTDEEKKPTYEIRRGLASDTAGADSLVNKYRLHYDQLKERL